MKILSILYKDRDSVLTLLGNGNLRQEDLYLVRIYTAAATKAQAVQIAKDIKELLPNAKIIGSSAAGIMFHDELYEEENMVVFESFNKGNIDVASFSWKNRPAEAIAKDVADFAANNDSIIMHVLSSDRYDDSHAFVCEFNRLNNTTKLVGGTAGDIISKGEVSYVFDHRGIKPYSIIVASISGKDIKAKSWVNISHEPISDMFTVTESQGDVLKKIDGIDAKEWIREQLGLENLREFSDWQVTASNDEMVRFPIVLEGHSGASRFLRYSKDRDAICQYNSRLPEGAKFKIGYTNPKSIAKNAYGIARNIATHPVESLFFYSCFFRKLYLSNCAQWEMSPYQGNGLCGAFLMGEIGNIKGENEYLNGSSVLVGIADEYKYIKPVEDVFNSLNVIEDEAKELLNFALLKQRQLLSSSNEKLLKELLYHQEQSIQNFYLDSNTGLLNYLKYKEDFEKNKYDKLCMIRIENSVNLTAYVGHECYLSSIKREAKLIKNFISFKGLQDSMMPYSLSDDIIFIAANKDIGYEAFIDYMDELFKKVHFFIGDDERIVLVSRFILVFDHDELVEAALTILQANRQSQIPFLICNSNEFENTHLNEEFKILSVLNRALENDGVIPYFQGIYDNNTGTIVKYEALMRIKDTDGTIYIPFQFMNIAKKYHLYSQLSKIMIGKVFELSKNMKEAVAINFSAYDINSEEMQNIIFEKLEETGRALEIILEVVEDEPFESFEKLSTFVDRVREYGVKIAIDDFGSGYSNFLEIIAIRPDFVKLDGGIVKTSGTSEVSDMVMDTVIFLSRRIGSEIVAEFVENSEIQKLVESKGIRYSQGYHFSIPDIFEDILSGE